jgi:hypothetical protein
MNNWDKVDKKKRAATEDDVRWEYVKLVAMGIVCALYVYFLFIR